MNETTSILATETVKDKTDTNNDISFQKISDVYAPTKKGSVSKEAAFTESSHNLYPLIQKHSSMNLKIYACRSENWQLTFTCQVINENIEAIISLLHRVMLIMQHKYTIQAGSTMLV